MELIVKCHFDAAHHLPNYVGKCANLHGHRWEVEVVVEGIPAKTSGMIVDFKILKEAIDKILPDHRLLNEVLINPTAELLARGIFNELLLPCEKLPVRLISVTIWETPDCGARYSVEDK